jgi:cobalt/nickel transport system ATP-binding protein
LQAQTLYFAYDEKAPALNGVSLDVQAGEKIAVLGRNGAGKSTFFMCLNGILHAGRGKVLLHGQEIGKKQLNLLREHVGVVFQNADDQIIASTVEAEISFGPMNLRLPLDEVRRRVDEAVGFMSLAAYRRRPPHRLSGGEKKRVTIADILAMESEIILFDEPQASLDPAGARLLEEVLARLHQSGKTLLISTHDMDFAFRWADRVVVFSGGQITADGAPETVFRSQETLDQAGLCAPSMLTVFDALCQTGCLPKGTPCPRTAEELTERLFQAHGG